METCLILAASVGDPTLLETIGSYAWTFLTVGAGLGFVIFVHELGHFLVAKACGVKCEKFYIGFDIPLGRFLNWLRGKEGEFTFFGLKVPRTIGPPIHWGETEYGIGILPLGGYVKMLGQDDDPRNAEAEAERTKVAGETGKVELDPRSYPAKSVPARMAIISAGVIMNLIFGVILAAAAYRMGVPEVPAQIGSTASGSPAWQKDLRPGSKIVQFGENGQPYDSMRWEDLMNAVILNGADRDLHVVVTTAEGQTAAYDVRPTDRYKSVGLPLMLGLSPATTRDIVVRKVDGPSAYRNLKTNVPLMDRDELVAIDGQRISVGYEVPEILIRKAKGDLRFTVARVDSAAAADDKSAPKKEFEVIVPARPMRETGAILKMGPVAAVRENSPAEKAGFTVGDVITEVNGQPVGDPLTLGQRLAVTSDTADPVPFVVTRTDSSGKATTVTLTVQPELAFQYQTEFSGGGPVALEAVGLAVSIVPEVVAVVPGSPAEKAGLAPGDKITEALFVAAGEKQLEQEKAALGPLVDDPIVIDNLVKTWPYVIGAMQQTLPDTKLKLTYTRGGKQMTAELLPRDSESFFDESRGLDLYSQRTIHQAKTWGEAFSLGFRETKERLKEVATVLSRLLTGRLSPTLLSGPGGIMVAAGHFGSAGIPKMLIFLTMLSANLALLNFLPIPALDGGHMVFLTAEWVRGKPVDERLQGQLTLVGVACLLGLMVFATAMDIGRLATWLQHVFG